MEKFQSENEQKTENTAASADDIRSASEDRSEGRMDGREKEWQDRGRVQQDIPDPDVKTNIERDFEPLDDGRAEKQKPADPEY